MPRPLTIAALLILLSVLAPTARPDSGAGSDGGATQGLASDRAAAEKAMRSYLRKTRRDVLAEDWAGELENYRQAIAAAPTRATGYLCRGIAFLDRKEFGHAVSDFAKVIELTDPDSSAGHMMRAAAWLTQHDYVRAIADYDAVLARGDDWVGYIGRGEALLQAGEYDRAIADLTKSIELAAREVTPQQPYQDLFSCPRRPRIIGGRDRLFGVDDSSGAAWGDEFAYRGAAWFYKTEYDRALADIDRSMELYGYSPVANAYRGLIRLALGKCSMGFNDLKLAAHFAEVPFERLMTNAGPFVASTDCAGKEP
jgi:tetratricopeptide (TPR) repeat protein